MWNVHSNFDETAGKDVEGTGPYIQPQATAPGITMEDVTPERPVYGETSGRLLPPEKVARGRMQELIRLNDHNVASEVPEETAVGYKVVGTRVGSRISRRPTMTRRMCAAGLWPSSSGTLTEKMCIKAHRLSSSCGC